MRGERGNRASAHASSNVNPNQAPHQPTRSLLHFTASGLLGLSLLVACDPGDDLDEGGRERAAPTVDALQRASEEAFLESLEYEPSPEVFEYVGHLDDGDIAPLHPPRRLLEPSDPDDRRADLVEITTRDGRVYRQRPGTESSYTSHRSRIDDQLAGLDLGTSDDTEAVDDLTFRELITDGIDNRTRVTTKTKQGVMVKVAGSSTSTGTSCSASMIAPRVFLTAAHCITDDNGNYDWGSADWVMPSARGRSYSGSNTSLDSNDTPWGARQVTRVIRPLGWLNNRGPRFDYALLVIGDHGPDGSGSVQWDPAPVSFAYDSCNDLVGDGVNLRGYPGRTKTCADASSEDGTQCGGYAYTEYGPIDACDDDAIYYNLDSQGGQSGSPVYRYDSSTGLRTVVGINKGTDSPNARNRAHKIRSGSYSTICNAVEDPQNASSYFSNPSC